MSNFKITGILHVKEDAEAKTEKFTVRDFVLKTQDGNYEQYVKFQLVNDRCDLIDGFNPGQELTVHFDLRGREWQGKYFTTLNAWKLESSTTIQAEPQSAAKTQENKPEGEPVAAGEDESGELPF